MLIARPFIRMLGWPHFMQQLGRLPWQRQPLTCALRHRFGLSAALCVVSAGSEQRHRCAEIAGLLKERQGRRITDNPLAEHHDDVMSTVPEEPTFTDDIPPCAPPLASPPLLCPILHACTPHVLR